MGTSIKKGLLKVCDRLRLFPLFNIFTRNRAAVFMLHHFCAAGVEDFRSMRADTLEQCLRYITDHGYNALSLSEFVDRLFRKRSLYKSVVFTVDDGYRDFLQHGFPVFSKYDIPVAVFITTDFIDGKISFWWDNIRRIVYQTKVPMIKIKIGDMIIAGNCGTILEKERILNRFIEQVKKIPKAEINDIISKLGCTCHVNAAQIDNDALTWSQILELADQGVEFYPHTCTHPILSQCTDADIEKEISRSKKVVSTYLKRPADIFCYPNGQYGDFDDRVIKALRKEGYKAAFTSEEGYDCSKTTLDLYKLRRYSLNNDQLRFKQIISGFETIKSDIGGIIRKQILHEKKAWQEEHV